MTQLTLRAFGVFEVLRDSAVVSFTYDKVRALLIVLALEPGQQSRERVAALLWPEQPDNQARANLRRALANLRTALGDTTAHSPYVLGSRTTVGLNPASSYSLDVMQFEALIADYEAHRHPPGELCVACRRGLERALELYRADFLAQFSLTGNLEFNEWVTIARTRLQQRMLAVLAALAANAQHERDWQHAEGYLRRYLAIDPWAEDIQRSLMLVLASAGQRSAALQEYERSRALLASDLGIELEAATVQLFAQIRAGLLPDNPKLHQPARSMLPTPPSSFIGRSRDIETIAALLQRNDVRLLTLTGSAGAGKTRLALAVAQAHQFAPEHWFVDLAPLRDPGELLPLIAQTLGLYERDDKALETILQQQLASRSALLLLDNFEHIVDAGIQIASLLNICPLLKILVTSRIALDLYGEWEYPVPPLGLPPTLRVLDVPRIREAEAVRLFVDRAQAVRRDFTLNEANAALVVAICRRLDGLPLAIELAAVQLRRLSLAEIVAQLQDRLDLPIAGPRDHPERQRTLQAALSWSYALLKPAEQALFRLLAVFAGGWTLTAAETLAAGYRREVGREQGSDRSVRELLTALQQQSLLLHIQSETAQRYTMLETMRSYAAGLLAQHGETADARAAHAAQYLQLAEQLEPWLRGEQQESYLAELEREHDNLRVALQYYADTQAAELMLRLCGALGRFWLVRGHFSAGRRWVEQALRLPATAASAARAKALDCLGRLAWAQSDYSRAQSACEESLALHRAAGNQRGQAIALHTLGAVAGYRGDYAAAAVRYTQSLTIKRKLGDAQSIAVTLNNLAITVQALGDAAQARVLLEESLALRRAAGDKGGVAESLHSLGDLALAEAEYARATAHYRESFALYQEVGDRESLPFVFEGLARVAAVNAELERAGQLWGAAQALREELGSPLPPSEQTTYSAAVAAARSASDGMSFETAWAQGRKLALDGRSGELLPLTTG
jgi:predicted ATPase/DNA-binding SARP family transcriptional activator